MGLWTRSVFPRSGLYNWNRCMWQLAESHAGFLTHGVRIIVIERASGSPQNASRFPGWKSKSNSAASGGTAEISATINGSKEAGVVISSLFSWPVWGLP